MNLILISFFLLVGQVVTLPPEIHGQPGQFISIPSATDCKSVQWVVLDAGLNLFPVELLRDTTTAVVSANNPGKYRVLAYAAKGDQASKPALTTVIIGDPPDPVPTPDESSKLQRELKSLYVSLTEDDKQGKVNKLSSLYSSFSTTVKGEEVTTAGELLALCKEAVGRVLSPSDLREIRVRIQSELVNFPTDPDAKLDDKIKKMMSGKFMEISKTLERITK